MIDPTSKDDPKFKELVKVRRGSWLECSCWGKASGVQALVGKSSDPRGLVKGALTLR